MYSFRLSLFVHLNTEPTKYYRSQHYAPKIRVHRFTILASHLHHTHRFPWREQKVRRGSSRGLRITLDCHFCLLPVRFDCFGWRHFLSVTQIPVSECLQKWQSSVILSPLLLADWEILVLRYMWHLLLALYWLQPLLCIQEGTSLDQTPCVVRNADEELAAIFYAYNAMGHFTDKHIYRENFWRVRIPCLPPSGHGCLEDRSVLLHVNLWIRR